MNGSSQPPQLTADQREFLLADFAHANTDMLARIERIEQDMAYGLLAAGGLGAWSLSREGVGSAAYIPVAKR